MFRWLRVVGDTIFAAGAVALAIFIIGLRRGDHRGVTHYASAIPHR